MPIGFGGFTKEQIKYILRDSDEYEVKQALMEMDYNWLIIK